MAAVEVLERFVKRDPLAVMSRAVAVGMLDERLDDIFEQQRSQQYERTLKLSLLARTMTEVALGFVDNRHQAYREFKDELQVSAVAYYGKLNRTEPAVSEGVVSHVAQQSQKLLDALRFQPWEPLRGYRCLTIDGNHLQQTEKRLKETRGLCAAPLPGTVVARFDHQTGLFDRAYLLEDAHAQESSVLDRAAADFGPRDLVIADRHFCIVRFLLQVAARCGCFVIRQHGRLKGTPVGQRRRVGRIASGVVYEQQLDVSTGEDLFIVRRITVELDQPTRDGETEIHVLSNVSPDDADACELADLYRQRWEIENAFHVLTMTLTCEVNSICHPRCALFLFCLALCAYNCRQVVLAGLYAEHPTEEVDRMSHFHMALDLHRPQAGMETAITPEEWFHLVPRDTTTLAHFLRRTARHVDVGFYRKSTRGPKKPPATRKRCKAGTHVSTAKLLSTRFKRC